jgi:hypothetical protein
MNYYEIRTASGRQPCLTSASLFFSDAEAVAAAHRMIGDGEVIEVTRGNTLIYRSAPSTAAVGTRSNAA